MTTPLFRDDAYLREAGAVVTAVTDEGGIILDASLFYPQGGGQPGDSGSLRWGDAVLEIASTIKGDGDDIVLVPAEASEVPGPGQEVVQVLDWERRYRHMRVHSCLHLLSVLVPYPVTGGAISVEKGRLDFAMSEPIEDKAALESDLNALIAQDFAVTESWISSEELDASPALVKTMSVKPPKGQGRVRLVRIGSDDEQIDLQPCGGTHVAHTGEIGDIRIGKVEKKGRQNRRINVLISGGSQ